jgi:hypothetical protein
MPMATQFKPCYLCGGEKLIRVRQTGGDRYIGCPACKKPGEAIGEGFSNRKPAELPGIYRLAVAVCENDHGKILAEQYGLEYKGKQSLGSRGEGYLFQDLITGTSLIVQDLTDLEEKLREVRAKFQPR